MEADSSKVLDEAIAVEGFAINNGNNSSLDGPPQGISKSRKRTFDEYLDFILGFEDVEDMANKRQRLDEGPQLIKFKQPSVDFQYLQPVKPDVSSPHIDDYQNIFQDTSQQEPQQETPLCLPLEDDYNLLADHNGIGDGNSPDLPQISKPQDSTAEHKEAEDQPPEQQNNSPENEEKIPEAMKCQLYKHQLEALRWMKKVELDPEKRGGILADEMGLGKTLSAVALMLSDKTIGDNKVCTFLFALSPYIHVYTYITSLLVRMFLLTVVDEPCDRPRVHPNAVEARDREERERGAADQSPPVQLQPQEQPPGLPPLRRGAGELRDDHGRVLADGESTRAGRDPDAGDDAAVPDVPRGLRFPSHHPRRGPPCQEPEEQGAEGCELSESDVSMVLDWHADAEWRAGLGLPTQFLED